MVWPPSWTDHVQLVFMFLCLYSRLIYVYIKWWYTVKSRKYVLGVYTDNRRILMGLYSSGERLIFGRKNSSISNLLNLLFFLFILYKLHVLAFFTSCKMKNMFKANNKDTRIRKVNDKIKRKDTVDVVLASLLLTLNTFHFLLQSFNCWLW